MSAEKNSLLRPEQVDLHRHLEGSIKLNTLLTIFESFKHFGVTLRPETIAEIREYDRKSRADLDIKGNRNSRNFFKVFQTRVIQFMAVKLMSEISDPKVAKSVVWEFYSQVNAHEMKHDGNPRPNGEGLAVVNHLVSVTNMVHDIQNVIPLLNRRPMICQEEHDTYLRWQYDLKAAEREKRSLSLEQVIRLVGKTREEVLKKSQFGNMDIKITLSFRRDFDFNILTHPKKMRELVHLLQKLFAQGCFDIVDICGDESDERFPLSKFVPFLIAIQEAGIEYTVHLAELPYHKRGLAVRNIRSALSLPKKALAITHMNRLSDLGSNGEPLLGKELDVLVKEQTILNFAGTSNLLSGIVPDLANHRNLKNLLSEPKLRPYVERLLWLFCTDDPGVFTNEDVEAMAIEIATMLEAVENMRKNDKRVISPVELEAIMMKNVDEAVKKFKDRVKESREKMIGEHPELARVGHNIYKPDSQILKPVREHKT